MDRFWEQPVHYEEDVLVHWKKEELMLVQLVRSNQRGDRKE